MSIVLLLKSQKSLEVLSIDEIALDCKLAESSLTQRTGDFSLALVYVGEDVLVHAIGTKLMLTVYFSEIFVRVFLVADITRDLGIKLSLFLFLSVSLLLDFFVNALLMLIL